MPKVMKPPTDWDEDDIDTGYEGYDGPVPPPALYKGKVKKLLLTQATNKETQEKELRILVICDIAEGKYKGAGATKWLQLTKQGRPWFHQFLHALTDGSEEQKAAIRKSFKENGYAVGDQDDKKRFPIVRIGKKTDPIGKIVSFVTKINDRSDDGVKRCEIVRFVSPINLDDDDDEATPEDVLDSLGDDDGNADESDAFATDDDSGVQDLDSDSDATVEDPSEEPAAEESSDTTDDPWSV